MMGSPCHTSTRQQPGPNSGSHSLQKPAQEWGELTQCGLGGNIYQAV